jgi:hypothetical protein
MSCFWEFHLLKLASGVLGFLKYVSFDDDDDDEHDDDDDDDVLVGLGVLK